MPLNSVGLMPGRLEHTNEVTVLLGDNYFAERSATQARDILGRRIEHVSRLAKEEEAALDEALGQQLAGEQVQQRLDKLRAGAREGQEGAAEVPSARQHLLRVPPRDKLFTKSALRKQAFAKLPPSS